MKIKFYRDRFRDRDSYIADAGSTIISLKEFRTEIGMWLFRIWLGKYKEFDTYGIGFLGCGLIIIFYK